MRGYAPGPWVAVKIGDGGRNGEVPVFSVHSDGATIAAYIHESDARLIAAAPDGLAFALAFLEWHEGPGKTDSPLAEQARAFVAKAAGTP